MEAGYVISSPWTGAFGLGEKTYLPRHANTCFMSYTNNKGADQPDFVVRCLDRIISLVFIRSISLLSLHFIAEQAGLSLA